MDLSLKLEAFEGPLDLLLHLIDKNKVNIYDIPIAEITNQYMEYLHAMQQQNLNVMSEFLVMAATLLDIKARMLLPKEVNEEGEEEDPRAELVQRLLEYKMYKYMSEELKDRMMDAEKNMYRAESLPEEVRNYRQPVNTEELLDGVTLAALHNVFTAIMRRQEDKIDPIRSHFGKVTREEVSLSDRIGFVQTYARNRGRFKFGELLLSQKTKMQRIVTFLAVLELVKGGRVTVAQETIEGDIEIEVTALGEQEFTEEEMQEIERGNN